MSLKRIFQVLLGVQFLLSLGLVFLTVHLFLDQKELSKSRDVHFRSYLLADELRQSSDDLTRLARTYVATGNEEFERQYWTVLDIRNGKFPRPVDYNHIYWDLVAAIGQKPRPDGPAVSLHELMLREGFTKAELDKLALAQKHSDELVGTEKIAMNAVKGLFADSAGNFTIKKKPERALAIRLMHDEAYHGKKGQIMKPIDEFYVMFEERTAKDVAKNERRLIRALWLLGALTVVIMGMFVFSFVAIQKQIVMRMKVEEALRVASQYSRSLLETSLDPLVTINREGKITDVNMATEKATGISREKLIGTDFVAYFTEPAKAGEVYQQVFLLGAVNDYPLTLRHVSGRTSDVLYNASVYKDQAGEVHGVFAAARDITERKRMEEALEFQKKFLAEMLENMEVGVVACDQKGELILFNRVSREWHGLDPMKIPQEEWARHYDLYMGDGITPMDVHTVPLARAFRGQRVRDVNMVIAAKDQPRRYILAHAAPIEGEDGRVLGAVATMRDVTKSKEAEEELKKLTNAKTKFASMVSHELRSPLAVIKESLDVALDGMAGPVNEELKRILEVAKKNIDRLGRLINNVLDFQKIEAGKMEFDVQENDLNEVAAEVCKSMSVLSEKKGLELRPELGEGLSKVKFNRDKIIQVLMNLVSNAIKYTERGGVTVITRREDGTAHVMVRDTGPGIKDEDMPHLFQPFAQLDGGSGKKKGGTGLGLAISKEIILAHGGRVWAEAGTGKGTTFHFTLPL